VSRSPLCGDTPQRPEERRAAAVRGRGNITTPDQGRGGRKFHAAPHRRSVRHGPCPPRSFLAPVATSVHTLRPVGMGARLRTTHRTTFPRNRRPIRHKSSASREAGSTPPERTSSRGLYSVGSPVPPPFPRSLILSQHAPRRVALPPPRGPQGQVPFLRSVVPILAVLASALAFVQLRAAAISTLDARSDGRRRCLAVIDFVQTKNSFLFCCLFVTNYL
jgi:hypothetical protein